MSFIQPASTASPLSHLAEEILESILRLVKDTTSSKEFCYCLQTCQQWHRIGIGLYQGLNYAASVTIESDIRRVEVEQENDDFELQLFSDLETNPPSQLFLSELKSLTIHVRHARITGSFVPSPRRDFFRDLANSFLVTRKLTTFSFKFLDEGWDFPSLDVPAVAQSKIASLVEALPNTVINLELDTAGTEVPPGHELIKENQRKHICYQINKILLRLRHLRLRLGHLCSGLLTYEPIDCPLVHESGCAYCPNGELETCSLVRSWSMRTMTIWLPWGQTHDSNSFAQASRGLLRPNLQNPVIISVIDQKDFGYPERRSITEPRTNIYTNFCWTAESNILEDTLLNLQYFWCKSVFGRSLARNVQSSCIEHQALIDTPRRWFEIGRQTQRLQEPGSTSAYPYIAEWSLEHMGSWMQNGYLRCRHPFSEGDIPGTPFWKDCHAPQTSRLTTITKAGSGLWSCLFPKCGSRSRTLIHLRGHHIYAHPEYPNLLCHGGVRPCTFPGCERIGAWGFKDNEEYERHLLGHHLKPCTAKVVHMAA